MGVGVLYYWEECEGGGGGYCITGKSVRGGGGGYFISTNREILHVVSHPEINDMVV